MTARLISCFLLAVALCAGAVAQEHQGATYTKPGGWEEGIEGGAKVFVPNDLKEGEVVAIIMTGAVQSDGTSWEKQFTATIAVANDGGKPSDAGKVEKREIRGATLLLQSVTLDHQELGKHSRLYAQVSRGEQRIFITVVSNRDELLEKYGEAVSEFIGGLGFKQPTPPPANPASTSKGIPTGNTPDVYPGSPGWLPSGRGVAIPAPSTATGKPVGLWWKFTYDPSSMRTKAVVHIYLPDGTRASNPRLGGGSLYDLEGQRAQRGASGVGTFTVAGGQMVERYDGFENKGAFSISADASGPFFKIGGGAFRPLLPATGQSIVGHWKGSGVEYRFKPDGTFQTGVTHANGEWAVIGFDTGTYQIDGYLILLKPSKAAQFITLLGRAGDSLIIGNEFYRKP